MRLRKALFGLLILAMTLLSMAGVAGAAEVKDLAGVMLGDEATNRILVKELYVLPDGETVMLEARDYIRDAEGSKTKLITYIGRTVAQAPDNLVMNYKMTRTFVDGEEVSAVRDYKYRQQFEVLPSDERSLKISSESDTEGIVPSIYGYNVETTNFSEDLAIYLLESIPANGEFILQPYKHNYRYVLVWQEPEVCRMINEQVQKFGREFTNGYAVKVFDESDEFLDCYYVDYFVNNIYTATEDGWRLIFSTISDENAVG